MSSRHGKTPKRFYTSYDDTAKTTKQKQTLVNPSHRVRRRIVPTLRAKVKEAQPVQPNDIFLDIFPEEAPLVSDEYSDTSTSDAESLDEPPIVNENIGLDRDEPMQRLNEYLDGLNVGPQIDPVPGIAPPLIEYIKPRRETRQSAERNNWNYMLPKYMKEYLKETYRTYTFCCSPDCQMEGLWRCMDCDLGRIL